MTIPQTAVQLRSDAANGPLLLNRSTLKLGSFGLLLDLLEVDELSLDLSPSDIDETANTIELRGRATLLGTASDVSLLLEQGVEDQEIQCTIAGSAASLTLLALTQLNVVPTKSLNPRAFPEFAFAGADVKAESRTGTLSVAVQNSSFDWKPISGLDLNLEGIGFALDRVIQNGGNNGAGNFDRDDRKSVSLSLTGTMKVGSTVLDVALQLPTNPFSVPDQWGLTLSTKQTFSSGLSDLSQLLTNGTTELNLPPGLDQLAALRLDNLGIFFNPVAGTCSAIALAVSSAEPWEVVPSLSVEQVSLKLFITNPADSTKRRVSTEIFGEIKFGETSRLNIQMTIPSGGSDWFLTLTEPLSLSGLAELVHLPGGLNVESLQMPEAISSANLWLNRFDLSFNPKLRSVSQIAVALSSEMQWNIISTLQVGSPSIGLHIDNPFHAERVVTGSMRGMMTLDSAAFVISADNADLSSGWLLSGALQPGDTISLAAVAKDLFDGATLPEGLPDKLSALEFSIQPQTEAFTINAGIDDEWRIPFGAADLVINEARLIVAHAQDAAIAIDVHGMMTIADVKVPVIASRKDGVWKLEGKTDDQQNISFIHLANEVFRPCGFDLPPDMPDTIFKNLSISYDSGSKDFSFAGESKARIPVNFGNNTRGVDVQFDLKSTIDPKTNNRQYAGFLRADITLGGAPFKCEYDFGDGTMIKASWDGKDGSLNFADLADAHGIEHTLQVPGGLPLDLTSAAFEYDISKGRLVLSADSKYGEAFFIVSNANDKWDFVFGVLIKFSEIPGFPTWDGLSLKDSVLILSTVQDDNFVVPSLPEMPAASGQVAATGLRTFPTLGTSKLKLTPGVTVAALLELGNGSGSNVVLKNLSDVVGKTELLVQAAFDTSKHSASFLTYLDGSLTIAGSGSEKLVLSNVFVKLNASPFAVMICGTLLIAFNHVTLEASGALAISDNEMEAIFTVKAEADGKPVALRSPFALRGVSLEQIAVEVGTTFEPPSVNLGFEGKFVIGDVVPLADADDFTVVLALEGEVPDPLYLSTHIHSLTIKDMITAYFGPEVTSDAPDILTKIKGEELSVYWSETSGIVLPDGTTAKQGFGFNGILNIAGFTAHAALTVSDAGVSGDAELPPMDWSGVFSLTGNGKGVTVGGVEKVPPGGATIALNSKHSPFIDVSAKVKLFNLISDEVEIEVADDGFNYKQKQNIGSLFRCEFDCVVNKTGFSAHAQFDLDIKGDLSLNIPGIGIDLGTISLDVSFDTTLDVAVSAAGFTLGVSGEFDFEGIHMTMPTLTIKESFDSLEDLPGKIFKQIEDHAEDIFKEFLDVGQLALKAAEKEAEAIAAAVADEAKKVADEAAAQAEKVVADAKAAYETAAHDVAVAEEKAAELEQEAEKTLNDAGAEVASIGAAAADDAKALGDVAEGVARDAAELIGDIEHAVAQEVAQIGAVAEQALADAERVANEIRDGAEKTATAIKNAAEDAGKAIVNGAQEAASAMEHEAEDIGNSIANAARDAANWIANAGRSVC